MKRESARKRSRFGEWLPRSRKSRLAAEQLAQNAAQKDEYERLCEEIEAARAEWAIAQQHVDYVSDPELIDHAIYYLEAAERKYGYLLREAKKKYREKVGRTQVAKVESSF